jgi:CBS domain-containing protein
VPIVDDDGCLVGNISARDVKNMVLEPIKFAMMSKPIGEFLTTGIDLFTCKETDTLEAVVHKFQASRVRTLYVVDANNKPTSVVAICDLLAVFVKEPEVNWAKFQDFFDASWPAVPK